MKLEHFLTPYTKINSKWINNLNVRPETIKLLEENIDKTFFDINYSSILYDPHPRILEIKAKINKWDLIKIFCTTKGTISKVKRQSSEWEKIIANEVTDKGLISKIYKQLLLLNSRKINYPIKKWANNEWIRKLWYIYTMEYYSAIKKNSFESVLMRWIKLEPIIQSEVSQKDKDQYSILTYIYGI